MSLLRQTFGQDTALCEGFLHTGGTGTKPVIKDSFRVLRPFRRIPETMAFLESLFEDPSRAHDEVPI